MILFNQLINLNSLSFSLLFFNLIAVRNAALSAIVGGITDTVAALSMSGVLSKTGTPTTTSTNNNTSTPPPIPNSNIQQYQDDGTQLNDGANDTTEGKNYRMDVQDFIE